MIAKGRYVDNLFEMARLCAGWALDSGNPTPFFVLEQVFVGIARDWDGRPQTVEEAQALEAAVVPAISSRLLTAIEEGCHNTGMLGLSDGLVSACLAGRG